MIIQKRARITSKGQVTVPHQIRQILGVGPGDGLLFESDKNGTRVRPLRTQSPFAKYRGIGNPDPISGKKAIAKWFQELRGR
jgi:AbrB family looped-hinge helix DNA binding protein